DIIHAAALRHCHARALSRKLISICSNSGVFVHFFKLLALPAQTRAPSAVARWRNQQRALLASVAVTGLLTGVHSVQADPYSWIGGPDANWNDPTNWNPALLPAGGDDVVIGQSYSLVVVDARTV